MGISPASFAKTTRQSQNWADATSRVRATYREWIRAAPTIQQQYSIPKAVPAIRTRIRQEFERHRSINQLPVVDRMIMKSHMDFQETINYWRQTTHMMSYFKEENWRSGKRLPASFMDGFLEGRN